MDAGILSTEDLQRLEACLPTGPELKTVLTYDGPLETLGPAEAFFRALAPTPRPASKVSTLLFSLQFSSIVEIADARLETLSCACQEVTTSDRLARILDRVLVIGNLLNEGEILFKLTRVVLLYIHLSSDDEGFFGFTFFWSMSHNT